MSIKVMTYVWDGYPGSGSELLALLAMADWCDDRGGSLYPSMRAVGEKIRVSEKQARRIVQSLSAQGYLSVIGNANGGAPGTTKQFRLNVEKLKALADEKEQTPPAHVTPPIDVTPPMQGIEGSHTGVQRAPMGGSQSTIEPPYNQYLNTVAAPVALAPTKPAAMTASRSSKPKDDFLLPDWIDASHWQAWRSHPKLKNATAAQKQIAVEKLAKWREAGEDFAGALENAAASGYQGLFLPDNRTGTSRSSETGYQRSMREKYEQIAPRIAAKNPSAARVVPVNPTTFFENLAKQQLEHKHA